MWRWSLHKQSSGREATDNNRHTATDRYRHICDSLRSVEVVTAQAELRQGGHRFKRNRYRLTQTDIYRQAIRETDSA